MNLFLSYNYELPTYTISEIAHVICINQIKIEWASTFLEAGRASEVNVAV